MVDILDKREPDEGDRTEALSASYREGTAVREELSEENMVEPLVAEEVDDLILAPSNERLGPLDESVVDTES